MFFGGKGVGRLQGLGWFMMFMELRTRSSRGIEDDFP